jgi:hypothetical protein
MMGSVVKLIERSPVPGSREILYVDRIRILKEMGL